MGNNQTSGDEWSKDRMENFNQANADKVFANESSGVGSREATSAAYNPDNYKSERNEGTKDPASFSSAGSPPNPEKLMVYKSTDVKNLKLVGIGSFGKVMEGDLQGQHVAIKVFHSPLDMKQAQVQIDLLMNLNHRNLVKIKGIISSGVELAMMECPQVVYDCFPEGNVLKFLNKKGNPQDYAMLGKLTLDILRGCEYLHSQRIIHGNLAARNIMVEKAVTKIKTHFNAKVADYGISAVAKGCEGKNMIVLPSGKTVPVRWAPKELVMEGKCSSSKFASDVWSFGVVLWEMWTKGGIPFGASCTNVDVIKLLKEGKSPLSVLKPEGCPPPILRVMESIFKVQPNERPKFSKLKDEFESFKKEAIAKKKGGNAYGSSVFLDEAGLEGGKVKTAPPINPQVPIDQMKTGRWQQNQGISVQKAGPAPLNPNINIGHLPRGRVQNQTSRNLIYGSQVFERNPTMIQQAPPPYTQNPLPNHLAVRPGNLVPIPQMMMAGMVPQPPPFYPFSRSPSPKPNYEDEIERHRAEIKQLTAQKAADDIQRKTAELTEMIANNAANLNIGNPQAGYQNCPAATTGNFPHGFRGGHRGRGGFRGQGRDPPSFNPNI